VSGADRASYLQGLLTNDIAALTAGTGCYTAYLTAQGRMIADLSVYEIGDVILLAMEGAVKDTVLARLDQFIFSEDVHLGDVTDTFGEVAIVGPNAASIVAEVVPGVSIAALTMMREHDNVRAPRGVEGSRLNPQSAIRNPQSEPVIVARVLDVGEPGFALYAEREVITSIVDDLRRTGVIELDEATADAIRIESGTPRFGRDMDDDTIPLEAGIESRAISFTKGCYVGQEVIIRVLHRGHGRVARRLVGLRIEGSGVPASGATVRAGEREVGHVTSAAWSPVLKQAIALAYLHRDFVTAGTSVTIDERAAEVVSLPFVDGSRVP
jgi:folate-binding protein YgfZ